MDISPRWMSTNSLKLVLDLYLTIGLVVYIDTDRRTDGHVYKIALFVIIKLSLKI